MIAEAVEHQGSPEWVRPVRERPPRLYAVHVVLPALEQDIEIGAPTVLNAAAMVMRLCVQLELCTIADWHAGRVRITRVEER